MDLNELEEAFPGSRSLAFSEQQANKPTGEKKEKTMMPHKLIRFQTRTASPFKRGLLLIPGTSRLPCAFDPNASGGSSPGWRVSGQ